MSFDWAEYLDVAKSLSGQSATPPGREAALRAAISRAYYAAFCSARNHLRDRDNVQTIPLDGRAHFDVPAEFSASDIAARRQIGEDLNRLRLARRDADYYDQFPTDIQKKAGEVIMRAGRVISGLAKLPGR